MTDREPLCPPCIRALAETQAVDTWTGNSPDGLLATGMNRTKGGITDSADAITIGSGNDQNGNATNMKRLTVTDLNRYASNRSSEPAATIASFRTLTSFDVPSLPVAEWPLLPAVERAVERTVLTALDGGLSLRETVDAVSESLSAIGASLSHDDLLTRIAATGLQRS